MYVGMAGVLHTCTYKSALESHPSNLPRSGVLVAVGVVDVLPRCLSSKYLFWDPGGMLFN